MHKPTRSYYLLFAFAGVLGCVLLPVSDEISNAGIQGSGFAAVAIGRISGFGSVFVDGVEYTTSNAQIVVDDQSASEAQLQVGQIVTVQGTINANRASGTASVVSFTGDVEGPVAEVDAPSNSFVVLGQTIRVTDETIYGASLQAAGIGGLTVGATVEVSAFADASGDLVASLVDLKVTGSVEQVKGQVQSLDTDARTFRINALTINYSGVVPTGLLANGTTAIVQGVGMSPDGGLYATRVRVAGKSAGTANELGQIEGLITNFTSVTDFSVGNQRVLTSSDTHFVLHGQTLGPDVGVKVQGSFDSSGALVAKKVQTKNKLK
jgi:hypothetical protein